MTSTSLASMVSTSPSATHLVLAALPRTAIDRCPERTRRQDARAVSQALLIQYANPMSINCWAASALGIKTVGLCHSVQGTSKMLARRSAIWEVTFDSAGLNHNAWFTTSSRAGGYSHHGSGR